MHGFWSDVFKRAWHIGEAPFRKWHSWFGIALIVAGIYWADYVDLFRKRWLGGAVAAALMIFGIRAFLKAIRGHYKEKFDEAIALQDRVIELERDVRALQANQVAQQQAQQNVQQAAALRTRRLRELQRHQTSGINILDAIENGQFVEPRDPRRIDTWRDTVLAFLELELAQHVNDFRMPIPPIPLEQHPNTRTQYLNRLRIWLDRLRQVIAGM